MSAQRAEEFKIDGKWVGAGHPAYVIAEAGISHFGDYDKALKLVDLAVSSNADCVKFQTFEIDELISSSDVEWRHRLGDRTLSFTQFEALKVYCEKQGITFLSTAHDKKSLEFLHSIDVGAFKLGSGELGNKPYMEKVGAFGRPIIFSTGMYTMEDIAWTIDVLMGKGNRDIAILHCVTQYPTPPREINLNVMRAIEETFGGVVGYSDHTSGYHVPLASVALGAKIIEKHITLEYDIPNAQDWKVSCGPDNLGAFIKELREVESCLGSSSRVVSNEEEENKLWALKSLVASQKIPVGTAISEDMLVEKRPGTGISPRHKNEVIGRTATVTIEPDTPIKWENLHE